MMELETFAFIVAIWQLHLSVGFLLAPTQSAATILEVIKNPISRNLLAISWITLSILVLLDNPRVSLDAAGFIRLIAWLALIKCQLFIWRPGLPIRVRELFFSSARKQRLIGLFAMASTGALFWAGFVVRG